MKNLMKKLTAGLLAGVVLLGSIVMASASESQQLGQKHESVGATANEGAAPEELLSVVLPTARDGMFNFIIDPSGRIIRTKGKKYAQKYNKDVTVDDGKLYFVNFITADDTEIVSLSKKSEALKIINKSNFPLNVSWDVEIDKGSNEFVFSQDAAFKDVAASSPAMYLALVSDRATVPVSTTRTDDGTEKHSASINGWIKKPTADIYELTYEGGKYQYQEKEEFADVFDGPVLQSVSFYMTGAINDGNWPDTGDDVQLNVTWGINKEIGPDTDPNPIKPTVAVKKSATAGGQQVSLSVTLGDKDKVNRIAYTRSGAVNYLTPTIDGTTITFTPNAIVYNNASDWKVEYTIALGVKVMVVPSIVGVR